MTCYCLQGRRRLFLLGLFLIFTEIGVALRAVPARLCSIFTEVGLRTIGIPSFFPGVEANTACSCHDIFHNI